MKVFKRNPDREVGLDELMSGNPTVVPEGAAQVETEWTLVQAEPIDQLRFELLGVLQPERERDADRVGGIGAGVHRLERRVQWQRVHGTTNSAGISACSAKFVQNSVVTLTAVPPAGASFVNWAGACSGTSPVCQLTVSGTTSVQAVFRK
jgi:hypothetical protein